jgi:pimeloyl-ACP methyl ester carboxylesterase
LCATAKHFLPLNTRGIASAVFPGVVLSARLIPEVFRTRIINGMLEGVPPGPVRDWLYNELASSDPATVMQATRAVIRFSSHDWVSNIDVPTAVVVTTRDLIVPTKRQYELAAAIRGAKVFEVKGDHFACVRATARFVPALVDACGYVATAAKATD